MNIAELTSFLPVSSPFVRFAERYVDEAFGVAAGYNFFIFEASLVPFEMTAVSLIIEFWTDKIPVWGTVLIMLFIFSVLNFTPVSWYGEAEFWLAFGKLLLIVGLILFTFITMLGGNPENDRYGFRYWREPGSFREYYKTGSLGRFLGFLSCLIQASFAIAGPDYVAMTAGEAENPRVVMPRAFKAVFVRLTAFFCLGALCVGIAVPSNDEELTKAFKTGSTNAAASPYVVAMNRLKIPVLPHIVNGLILTSAISAGNSYVYCSSRTIYGLALQGHAPKILSRCSRQGVPYVAVALVMVISMIAFLQVSSGTAQVLKWIVNLVTASQLINFSVISFTMIRFHRACEVQGFDRKTLPFRSWWQPRLSYFAFVCTLTMAFVGGYPVFLPGSWSIPTFFFSYTMIAVFPIIYFGFKFWKKTKIYKPEEVDLITGVEELDEYERQYVPRPPKNKADEIWNKMF
ncbi:MAG: hypothetical protein M1814_001310 [Vezdaea aestivalis]|nr:MAG: hypothetical protein M1814_001310 [Vezdaea aestivalis]